MAAETETHALPEFDDLGCDLNAIPNQTGYAVLAASDGTPALDPNGDLSLHDCKILYKMLLECGELFLHDHGDDGNQKNFRRMNVEAGAVTYSICVTADGFVYIVKRSQKV